jgi:uncharacterized damage-inducible protein DinB
MAIAPTLLPEFDFEMAGCRRTLERVPTAQFGFQPHAKSFTLGKLANHLAGVPHWLVTALQTTELDFMDPATAARLPLPAATVESLLEQFDRGVREARAALAAASDADLATVWTGRAQGKVVLSLPRAGVFRGFIMNHMIHHRAQLTVYLRLLDLPVPALYGPSADEA